MEFLVIGLGIICASLSACFIVAIKEKNQADVAKSRDRMALEGSDNFTRFKIRELELDHEREQRMLGDGNK